MHEPQDNNKPRSQSPRVDVKPLKSRLLLALKENAKEYWATLKKFLLAKLSRKELETYAKRVLREDEIYLHNSFLRSILFNARHASPPPNLPLALQTLRAPPKPRKRPVPPSSPPTPSTTRPLTATEPTKKQKIKPKQNVRAVPKPSDKRTKLSDKKTPKKPLPVSFTHKPGVFPLSSPDLITLRGRMVKICTESGLRCLADDAVTLMMLALEQHIKDILRGCHPHYRPHPLPPSHRRPPLPHEGISAGDILNIHQLIGVQHPPQNTLLTPPLANPAAIISANNHSSLSSSSIIPIAGTNTISTLIPSTAFPKTGIPLGNGIKRFGALTYNTKMNGDSNTLHSSYFSNTPLYSITVHDLYKTVELHPYLLGEDLPLNQEKMNLSQ